jgi:hypothetical protein
MNPARGREEQSTSAGRSLSLSAWCVTAAFGTYFCMYGFRKPFTAAAYGEVLVWGIGYKAVLVTAQVLGYSLSKVLGIKVVAEVEPGRRAALILGLIAAAETALLLFGLTPPPFNVVCLFCNGLPLGMVFGLVLRFLEGRRQTEALAAGLCGSFILADGVTKSAGASLLQAGISEYWMPAVTGLLFYASTASFHLDAHAHPPAVARGRGSAEPASSDERRRTLGLLPPLRGRGEPDRFGLYADYSLA